MAVTTIFAGAADGDILSQHASDINAAFNGTGTLATPVNTANELWIGQFLFGSYSVYESFVDFDLSSIHTGQVCSAATMQTYLITDQSVADFTCAALVYDWGATVTTGDWQDVTEMGDAGAWWTTLPTSGIGATGAYKSWNNSTDIQALCTLLAGSEINFCLTSDLQIAAFSAGTAYVTFSSTNVVGTTQDPKITITHAQVLQSVVGAGGMVLGGAATITTIPLASIIGGGGVVLGGAATTTFTHGPAVPSDLVIEWQFDGVTYTDVTDRFMDAEWTTGKTSPSGLDKATPGKFGGTVRNEDNAFSSRNTTSPYTTGGNTLATGRKLRVRTATSSPTDPELLVRDRFARADSTGLGTAETGQTYTDRAGGFDVVDGVAKATAVFSTDLITTVDTGVADFYAQCTVRQMPTINRRIGLCLAWVDASNYVYAYMDSNPAIGMRVSYLLAGVPTGTGLAYPVQAFEGMVVGWAVSGSTVTGYIGGVAVDTGTLNAVFVGAKKVGPYCFYTQASGRAPEVGDFHVWDTVAVEQSGVLFTGTIDTVEPTVEPGPKKLATVTASGPLAGVARADIAAPRLPRDGAPTGQIVGEVLHRAQALHPPFPLDTGAVTTGAAVPADGPALRVAQEFETMEQGFLVETPEGQVTFHDSARRATAVSEATFSDAPGMQFGMTDLVQLDPAMAIVNQVTAGVAPEPPSGITRTFQQGNSSTAVDIVCPTVAVDDLILVFVASSVNTAGKEWEIPIWWERHRDIKASNGMRIYSHFCDGTESGDTIRLYDDTASGNGLWYAWIYRIESWFESTKGIAMSEIAPGDTANAVLHGWGREPTLFICFQAGIGSSTGATFTAPTGLIPDGYYEATQAAQQASSTDAFDLGAAICHKVDAAEVERPSAFQRFTGLDTVYETVVVAVRGFNGEHTKATLDNPNTKGGDGIFITTDDVDSQDAHRLAPHQAPRWFATEADAETYNDSIITQYADDRSVLSIEYVANKSGHYRNLAIGLRLGAKITAEADDDDHAGLGIAADYFIEGEHHVLSKGMTLWTVRYDVSPA